MTALEHAKRFVQRQAATTALVILPLAVAAPAQATSVTFDVPPSGNAVTGGSAGVTPGGSGNFVRLGTRGVAFDGTFNFDYSATRSGSQAFQDLSATLTLFGTGFGTLDTPEIAALYDDVLTATAGTSGSVSMLSSSLQFSIETASDIYPTSAVSGITASGGLGTVNLTGWPTEDLTNWNVILLATFRVVFGAEDVADGNVHLAVNDISIKPESMVIAADAVPEPSSLALVAVGVGLVAARRRRRQTLQ